MSTLQKLKSRSRFGSTEFTEPITNITPAELKALKGMAEYLPSIDYIYSEVNADYVYKDCALITELDDYLATF
jgi:hypothetical protein